MTELLLQNTTEQEAWNLDACLKCSLCTEHCPVSEVNPLFAGPKKLGPDGERWRLELSAFGDEQLSLCTGCKQCEMACPAGVRITHMISRAKARSRRQSGGKFGDRYIADTELLGRLGTIVPSLANLATGLKPVRTVMQKVLGIEAGRPLPRFAGRRYRVASRHRPLPGGVRAYMTRDDAPARDAAQAGPAQHFTGPSRFPVDAEGRRLVVLFTGCYAHYYDPDLAEAVTEVLEHNGFRVIIPEQMCCGLPFLANGFPEKASHNARYNLQHIRPYTEAGIPMVVPSTSCALTLKSDYPDLVGKQAAAVFSHQVHELGAFLRDLWEHGELSLDFGQVDETFSYHEPCHLKALGNGLPFVEILRLVPGLTVEVLDAGCCGLSGTYGMKQRNFDVSMKIGNRLFTRVRERGHRVLTECETCKMQIEFGAEAETIHPVKVLRQAYRAAAAGKGRVPGSAPAAPRNGSFNLAGD